MFWIFNKRMIWWEHVRKFDGTLFWICCCCFHRSKLSNSLVKVLNADINEMVWKWIDWIERIFFFSPESKFHWKRKCLPSCTAHTYIQYGVDILKIESNHLQNRTLHRIKKNRENRARGKSISRENPESNLSFFFKKQPTRDRKQRKKHTYKIVGNCWLLKFVRACKQLTMR